MQIKTHSSTYLQQIDYYINFQVGEQTDYTLVQTLIAECRRFAMVRISDNGWK